MVKRVLDAEAKIEEKNREIRALQAAVVEMQSAITQERKRGNKLQADNDKLRVIQPRSKLRIVIGCTSSIFFYFQIRESENKRKILVLLEMCGKNDLAITRMIDEADKGENEVKSNIFVPEHLEQYIRESKVCHQTLIK